MILYNTTEMSHLKVVLNFIMKCWCKKVFSVEKKTN